VFGEQNCRKLRKFLLFTALLPCLAGKTAGNCGNFYCLRHSNRVWRAKPPEIAEISTVYGTPDVFGGQNCRKLREFPLFTALLPCLAGKTAGNCENFYCLRYTNFNKILTF